jgi:hypothetical protein
MADEYSDRTHCLRAIGNAVDQQVAEYAFVTLFSVIMENMARLSINAEQMARP